MHILHGEVGISETMYLVILSLYAYFSSLKGRSLILSCTALAPGLPRGTLLAHVTRCAWPAETPLGDRQRTPQHLPRSPHICLAARLLSVFSFIA